MIKRYDRLTIALLVVAAIGVVEHILRFLALYITGNANRFSVFGMPAHLLYWTGVASTPDAGVGDIPQIADVVIQVWFVLFIGLYSISALYVTAKAVATLVRWFAGQSMITPSKGKAFKVVGLYLLSVSSIVTWSFHYSIAPQGLLIFDLFGVSLLVYGLKLSHQQSGNMCTSYDCDNSSQASKRTADKTSIR